MSAADEIVWLNRHNRVLHRVPEIRHRETPTACGIHVPAPQSETRRYSEIRVPFVVCPTCWPDEMHEAVAHGRTLANELGWRGGEARAMHNRYPFTRTTLTPSRSTRKDTHNELHA